MYYSDSLDCVLLLLLETMLLRIANDISILFFPAEGIYKLTVSQVFSALSSKETEAVQSCLEFSTLLRKGKSNP